MAIVISFVEAKKKQKRREVFRRWLEFYESQPYDEVLESLVYEHENDFPLRTSLNWVDQERHRALVDVCDAKAQTEFLKSLIQEIRAEDIKTATGQGQ